FEEILPQLLDSAQRIGQTEAARSALEGSTAPTAAPASRGEPAEALGEGVLPVRAPLAGRVVEISVQMDAVVATGQTVAVLDAMKMEHTIAAIPAGRVVDVRVEAGAHIDEGRVLVVLEPVDAQELGVAAEHS